MKSILRGHVTVTKQCITGKNSKQITEFQEFNQLKHVINENNLMQNVVIFLITGQRTFCHSKNFLRSHFAKFTMTNADKCPSLSSLGLLWLNCYRF